MSEHTAQLERLRERITYYEAAFSLAGRISKVANLKQHDKEFTLAFLEGYCRAAEQNFYGSTTAAFLVRLRALEQERGIQPASEFPALSPEGMKEAERDLDRLLSDYSTALEAVEEKRYGGKLGAFEARLKRMEDADQSPTIAADGEQPAPSPEPDLDQRLENLEQFVANLPPSDNESLQRSDATLKRIVEKLKDIRRIQKRNE